jgi:hypothetical protein
MTIPLAKCSSMMPIGQDFLPDKLSILDYRRKKGKKYALRE